MTKKIPFGLAIGSQGAILSDLDSNIMAPSHPMTKKTPFDLAIGSKGAILSPGGIRGTKILKMTGFCIFAVENKRKF